MTHLRSASNCIPVTVSGVEASTEKHVCQT